MFNKSENLKNGIDLLNNKNILISKIFYKFFIEKTYFNIK